MGCEMDLISSIEKIRHSTMLTAAEVSITRRGLWILKTIYEVAVLHVSSLSAHPSVSQTPIAQH